MTYSQTLDYLFSRLPLYQKIGDRAYKEGLDNIIALLVRLGQPQDSYPTIHIAGTNGKGSSSHLIASVLQCAGYKTGLYTSPHLKDFTERIRVNGMPITQDFVVEFTARHQTFIEYISPSFFEVATAMAFAYFEEQKVDIAVIETGLGGRLDSTNVITPLISLITNIGLDHQKILGDRLSDIAMEKAGIIKKNVPVVISQKQEDIASLFINKAISLDSPLVFASDHYCYTQPTSTAEGLIGDLMENQHLLYKELRCGLAGIYQQQNIPGVIGVVEGLKAKGYTISETTLRQGFAEVVERTGIKGRWQILQHSPKVIADTGHNADGIRQVVAQLKSLTYRQSFIILGMVNDKDHREVLSLLPPTAHYIFCQPSVPRGLEAEHLHDMAQEFGLQGEVIPEVNQALAFALQKAGPEDLIFIGGSTFVVADLQNL